ncbi:hypothetical protein [Bosea vaviloviae]|uniref:Uncharacterized protein n=1 Tax=Bosea vaviloviae TaxID=1526658 RepID=A0A1D7U1N6_9HYPH|nr:hypothetical protein [Bosea vaviloviae]AOO81286.1 hypothetical protein BHK69_13175 [Bosea vaviloviae]
MSADDTTPEVISAVFSLADIVEDPLPLAVVMEAARSQGLDMQGLDIQGLDVQGLDVQGLDVQGLDVQGLAVQGLDMPAPALAELLVDPAGDVALAALRLMPPEDGISPEPLLSVALNRAFDSDNSVTVCVNSPLDGDWMWLPLGHSLEL